MTIFLSMVITAIVCIYFFKISPNMSKKIFERNSKFNIFMDKSDFENNIDKSDLISFRHEFGETIFEIQKEIESLKLELNDLRKDISNNKI
ncbi:hypothetical protein [Candidatus Arthromitus sp. SFB-turkey]|uniref:hypothetical protein n=1 Tax=Candidatus Arthromitus sp. SFB-turkey TaxID=1840217 RepID=UPI0007F3C207|nr:hypothetical protein [Candidatus Arthromitus sp. SFB-turkey]OAT88970.1 hypothetical protein A6P36_06440 [Candidatus Arthromitus sp. SFB-turkey]HJC99653.1 hypothetical protein [Candidatus Dwaynia gallinarum]